MKRFLLPALLFALPLCSRADAPADTPAPAAVASSLIRDLGRGLGYQRILKLPADLPNADASARKRPIVLDVRYAKGDAAAGAALVGWLKFYATVRAPVFVLANTETATPVLRALAERGAMDSVLVIGAPARDFAPDIAVQTTADAEHRAYDALAAGAEPASLIVENQDKARNDEASLSRDRSTEPDTEKEHAPAAPIDAALQRAVHLHRTLVALRKI